MHKELWASKVAGVPISRILGVLGQNDIWVLASWPSKENTIGGKVVASPKSRPGESCESVVARDSLVHQKCFNYALTNLLFGLCKSAWIIDRLVTRPSPHPRTLACPSTLKVLRANEHASTFYPSTIFTLDSHLNLSKSLGVRHMLSLSTFVVSCCIFSTSFRRFLISTYV